MNEVKFKNFSGATKAKVLAAVLGVTGAGVGIGYLAGKPLDKKIEGAVIGGTTGGALAGLGYLIRKNKLKSLLDLQKNQLHNNEMFLLKKKFDFINDAIGIKKKYGVNVPLKTHKEFLEYRIAREKLTRTQKNMDDALKNFKTYYDDLSTKANEKSIKEKIINSSDHKEAEKTEKAFKDLLRSTYTIGSTGKKTGTT